MPYLEWAGKIISNVKGLYMDMNPATLTGAIDVVVIRKPDDSLCSSPWHVRFGKMCILWANENVVDVEINGTMVDIPMRLGEAGEAYFLQEVENPNEFQEKSNDNFNNNQECENMISIDSDHENLLSENLIESETFEFKPTTVSESTTELKETDFNNSEDVEKIIKTKHKKVKKSKTIDENMFELELESSSEITIKKKFNVDNFNSNNNNKTPTKKSSKILNKQAYTDSKQMDGSQQNNYLSVQQHSEIQNIMLRCKSWPDLNKKPLNNSHENHKKDPIEEIDLNETKNSFASLDLSPECKVGSLPNDYTILAQNTEPELTEVTDCIDWKWGQLPQVATLPANATALHTKNDVVLASLEEREAKKKKKKNKDNKKEIEKGIYLEDLNDEDPELVKLYIYNNLPTTTTSSSQHGINPPIYSNQSPFSLPESPVSFDQTINNSTRLRARSCSADDKILESSADFTNIMKSTMTNTDLSNICLSLCGSLDEISEELKEEKFLQSRVCFEEFSTNTSILNHPSLIVRLHNKYYKWPVAAPMIMSLLVFKQNLPQFTQDNLMKPHSSRKETRRGWLGNWWGGSKSKKATKLEEKENSEVMETESALSSVVSDSTAAESKSIEKNLKEVLSEEFEIQRNELKAEKTMAPTVESENISNTKLKDAALFASGKYRKSLMLSSKQLVSLNLVEGINEATFSITTKYQGTTKVHCSIYLWNSSDKIVVSDIDGTITKSDVLGQIFPIVGQLSPMLNIDWSQLGIANLYTLIHQNGYRFMYLSARAIGQSTITRDYLRELKQSEYKLPVGPLFLSPSSLRSAFHKEVIERKPEEFKIECLRNIRALFPENHNPFTAGFGNRINDVWAYTAAGIPKARIFIVNHKGQLSIERTSFESSYSRLSDLVDHMFPSFALDSEYGHFNYWREACVPQHIVCENEAATFLEKYKKNVKKAGKDRKT